MPTTPGRFRVVKQDKERYAVTFAADPFHVIIVDHIRELDDAFNLVHDLTHTTRNFISPQEES